MTPDPGPRYERLEAWKACHELALVVCRMARPWPAGGSPALAAEAQRVAWGIGAVLLQGATCGGRRELRRATASALAALAQLEYLLVLARDLGHLDPDEWRLLGGFLTRAGQLVGGLHRALSRPAPSPGPPSGSSRPSG